MLKAVIQPDIVQVNNYQLSVAGVVPCLFTTVSGIEEELDTVELPDRTQQTGGRTKPGEFDVTQPMHHTLERLAMEAWFSECKAPVSPLFKKVGTLIGFSQTLITQVSYMLIGVFPSKRVMPDYEQGNEGDMGEITWTLKFDEIQLLS